MSNLELRQAGPLQGRAVVLTSNDVIDPAEALRTCQWRARTIAVACPADELDR